MRGRMGPGPASMEGLRWLCRVAVADRCVGCGDGLGSGERALSRGEADAGAMARTGGATAWEGLAVLRNRPRRSRCRGRRSARAGAGTDLVGSLGGVRLGRCVADRPRARPGRAARADRGSVVAGRGEGGARIAATGSHAGSRRHRPGPASGGDRGRAGAEVEGQAAGDPRPALAVDRERQDRLLRVHLREHRGTQARRRPGRTGRSARGRRESSRRDARDAQGAGPRRGQSRSTWNTLAKVWT